LQCGEQQRGIELALVGQAWDVAGDLERDGFRRNAARAVWGGDD
jgi:hypothetical protein